MYNKNENQKNAEYKKPIAQEDHWRKRSRQLADDEHELELTTRTPMSARRVAERTRQPRTSEQVVLHEDHLKHLRIKLMQTHASFDAAKNERIISTAP